MKTKKKEAPQKPNGAHKEMDKADMRKVKGGFNPAAAGDGNSMPIDPRPHEVFEVDEQHPLNYIR